MLVRSEAWNAKGEEGITGCSFKHTLTRACVPATFIPSSTEVCKWNQHKTFNHEKAREHSLEPLNLTFEPQFTGTATPVETI